MLPEGESFSKNETTSMNGAKEGHGDEKAVKGTDKRPRSSSLTYHSVSLNSLGISQLPINMSFLLQEYRVQ